MAKKSEAAAKKGKTEAKKSEAVYYGTGRRKESVARVQLVPGRGEFDIGGKGLEEYFGNKILCTSVRQPLKLTGTLSKFNIVAKLEGGGISGQAGALRHGISRALVEFDEGLRDELKKAGFLTRDPRMKERRKYGLKKARKAPQFSKR
ncbi:MAG: 30S ribosomal protein S9 [Actinomycetota bacterium]